MRGAVPQEQKDVDAVTTEVIRHGLTAAAEQMAKSIQRSARSQVVREMLDYSTAIFDIRGGVVAQSTSIPLHLNSMTRALQTLLQRYPIECMASGEVYATNDPYAGGQHLPDILTFAPINFDGACIGIAGTLVHHLDVGGRAPASYGADATEIYQEGLCIPPVRIVSDGELDPVFLAMFQANIRVPGKTVGDLKAQIAALSIGAGEVARLVSRYGFLTLSRATEQLVSDSERRMRAAIRKLPEGAFLAEDIVDGDGLDDVPLRIAVEVRRTGDELVIDLTGSAPQTRGPINCPIASTESAAYYAVMAMLDPEIPPNYGAYRPLRVIAPEGTVVNPRSPAPVVGRNVFTHRIATIVMVAIGKALPAKAVAPYYGNSNVFVLSTYDEAGAAYVHLEIEVGGWGARVMGDGPDGLSAGIQNLANNPIELVENEFPVRFTRYGFRPDSGGPGKYRGGMGLERGMELLTACELSTQFDRVKYPPFGIFGGGAGAGGKVVVERRDESYEVAGKTVGHRLQCGDRVTMFTQGGGGYGHPSTRDPAAIEADVQAGLVTPAHAREAYGWHGEENGDE